MIYQIDSLGNIMIVKSASTESTQESELVSEISFGSLPRVSFESPKQKDFILPEYYEYMATSARNAQPSQSI